MPFSLSSSALATAARSRPATRTTRRSGAWRCVRASRVHHLVAILSGTSCSRSRFVGHHVRFFAPAQSGGLLLSSLPAPSLRPPPAQRSPCFVVDCLILMMWLLDNPTRLSLIICAVLVRGRLHRPQARRRRVRLRLRRGFVHQVRRIRRLHPVRPGGRSLIRLERPSLSRRSLVPYGRQLLGVLRGRPEQPRAGRRHDDIEQHDLGGTHDIHPSPKTLLFNKVVVVWFLFLRSPDHPSKAPRII